VISAREDPNSINPFIMNCLIYARVPTDKQADGDLSIPEQLQAKRQYVGVMQEPVEQRRDRGGVAEQLAPIVDRSIRR
jgi:hypothetical protein